MGGPPETRHDMLRASYKLLNPRATCRDCDARNLQWWLTTNGKKLLFDPSEQPNVPVDQDRSLAVLHRHTCKGNKKEPVQQSLFQGTLPQRQQALGALAAACRARCVVLLQDDGMVYSFRPGLSGEDLAHELITAANRIRRDLEAQV